MEEMGGRMSGEEEDIERGGKMSGRRKEHSLSL